MTYEAELWVCDQIVNMTDRVCRNHLYAEPGLDPPIGECRSEAGNLLHEPAPMKNLGTFEFEEETAV